MCEILPNCVASLREDQRVANLVELVFGDLTTKQIRCGVFRSVPELIAAYITQRNAQPTPFVWTKTAQAILAKVNRARISLDETKQHESLH